MSTAIQPMARPRSRASWRARVIPESKRRGYGRACLTGLAAASNPDIVVFLDGDYSDRLCGAANSPGSDSRRPCRTSAIGSRLGKHSTPGALPWHAAFGNHLAAFLAFLDVIYGARITDLGPFRAARIDVLRRLDLQETTYGWAVEMILKGALQGFRIVEVPVQLLSAHRKIQDQRYAEGNGWSGLVHPGAHCTLLFLRHPKAGTSPAAYRTISYGIIEPHRRNTRITCSAHS